MTKYNNPQKTYEQICKRKRHIDSEIVRNAEIFLKIAEKINSHDRDSEEWLFWESVMDIHNKNK